MIFIMVGIQPLDQLVTDLDILCTEKDITPAGHLDLRF